jgi:hypothetical protein
MPAQSTLPRWLKTVNRLVVALQRRGVAIGTMRVLAVPGRVTGKLRATPVSPLEVGGKLYVVAGLESADWVKNAREAGWGMLSRGREQQRVAMVELPPAERVPVLREFPRLVPSGIPFFRRLYDLPSDPAALPEAFAALAPRCPVFRIEPLGAAGT